MTVTVSYLRESHLKKLKGSIEGNLATYLSGDPDWPAFFEGEDFMRTSSIPMVADLAECICMPEKGDMKDAENSATVYKSLEGLTLQQAADERVWAYLTHFRLWEYVQRRWPLDAGKPEVAIRKIRAHYFVSGGRGFYRDNGIARLWWTGWIASNCLHFGIERTLEILLHQSDVRANLLDRSSFGMSVEIFSAVMKRLEESYEGDRSLFKRQRFRDLMKHLNRRGGKVALNALEPEQLDNLIAGMLGNISSA